MVKQAEKRRRRNPFLPVLAVFLVIALFGAAWGTGSLIYNNVKAVRTALNQLPVTQIPDPVNPPHKTSQGQLMLTFMFWLLYLGIAYFFVAVLSGKDPESTKDIPMPPRERKKPKNLR